MTGTPPFLLLSIPLIIRSDKGEDGGSLSEPTNRQKHKASLAFKQTPPNTPPLIPVTSSHLYSRPWEGESMHIYILCVLRARGRTSTAMSLSWSTRVTCRAFEFHSSSLLSHCFTSTHSQTLRTQSHLTILDLPSSFDRPPLNLRTANTS